MNIKGLKSLQVPIQSGPKTKFFDKPNKQVLKKALERQNIPKWKSFSFFYTFSELSYLSCTLYLFSSSKNKI